MPLSTLGLNASVAGMAAVATHVALHTGNPGTTGAGEDTGVDRLPLDWATPASGQSEADEVPFEIPAGGGTRVYTHFSLRNALNPGAGDYIGGGPLDEQETYSDNGGTYRFTATLASTNPA